jgi:heme o synthase
MIKTYTLLTKPGIIMGNAIALVGGFGLASGSDWNLWLFAATLIGLCCIIGSACVVNNYQDRHLDAKMARTANRPLVRQLVSVRNALVFAILLGIAGTALLALTSVLALLVALLGYFVYVVLYRHWKGRSSIATLVGSVAGGVPPVVGYCAVSGRLDLAAFILFSLLVLWQMPHFYAIALYRLNDYAAASIPVLPLQRGTPRTKRSILLYIVTFCAVTLLLPLLGYAGRLYLVITMGAGLTWLVLAISGFSCANDQRWARRMFRLSLLVVTVLCLMLILDPRR